MAATSWAEQTATLAPWLTRVGWKIGLPDIYPEQPSCQRPDGIVTSFPFEYKDEPDEDEEPQDGSRADDSQWFARK